MAYGGYIDLETLDPNTSHAKVLSLIPNGTRVLEVGCANGRLARVLKQRGCYVEGVEIDPAMAEMAKEVCDRVLVGDFVEVARSGAVSEEFEVVLMADVLEHMCEPQAALHAARKLMRNDGTLVVCVPNVANWAIRWDLLRGRFRYNPEGGLLDTGHVHFFDLYSAREMLRDCGFEISGFDTVSSFPFSWFIGRIPVVRRLLRTVPDRAAARHPNFFGFQFIFVARPENPHG